MKVGIVEDRLEVISKYAYGKRILDLGCVGEGPSPSWLHFSLVQWGKEVLGVDIEHKTLPLPEVGVDIGAHAKFASFFRPLPITQLPELRPVVDVTFSEFSRSHYKYLD
jgi:hypothetical protein